MHNLYSLTKLLFSCWVLGGNNPQDSKSLPTIPGALDHALNDLKNSDILPQWASNQLHFVDGTTGLACRELPEILQIATEAKITTDPNPSYTSTLVVTDERRARVAIASVGLTAEQAIEIGTQFREHLSSWTKKLEAIPS